MRHLFIINPVAGATAKDDLVRRIVALATARRLDYTVHLTRAPGDAEEFVRQSVAALPGDLRVYACGGDGTLNEVINGIQAAPQVEVAVVPVGSGNDFVRNFTDSSAFLDLEAQIQDGSLSVDLIKVNGRLAINVVNAGLDAIVARNMTSFRALGRLHKGLIYPAAVVSSVLRPLNGFVELRVDSGSWTPHLMVIMVAGNGAYYGGGFFAVPQASVNDGVLDFCLMGSIRHSELPGLLAQYKRGLHVRHPAFQGRLLYEQCRKLSLRSDKPVHLALDGETTISREIELQILPAAQRVVMPRGVKPL